MLLTNMLNSFYQCSTFQVSSETSRPHVLPRNQCKSSSVLMMLYAQGLTSVPVCGCLAKSSLTIQSVSVYNFALPSCCSPSHCHNPSWLFIWTHMMLSYSEVLVSSFKWEQTGGMQGQWLQSVLSWFNSSMPRLCLRQNNVIELMFHRSSSSDQMFRFRALSLPVNMWNRRIKLK